MTTNTLLTVLQWLSAAGFSLLGVITVLQWARHRPDPQRGYLALAVGLLGGVSLIDRVAAVWGLSGPIYQSFTLAMFMSCGYALLLFRGTLVPLSRRARRIVLGLVLATIGITALVPLPSHAAGASTAATPLQTAATLLLLLVWCGCVVEPVIRLWMTSRRLSAVQRGRLRALVAGYGSIVIVLIVAVLGGSTTQTSWTQVATSLAVIVVMLPLLYVSFLPPQWLRRAWRAREEEALVDSMRGLIGFSSDRRGLAESSLDWAIRLVGADGGAIVDGDGTLLAVRGIADTTIADAAVTIEREHPSTGSELGLVCPLRLQDGVGFLTVRPGPFTPRFGAEEMRRVEQYSLSLAMALDHAHLVERIHASERDAQAANQMKSAFLASMSHELRTPLGAIIGFADVLADGLDGDLNEEQMEDTEQIRRSGRHLLTLLDEVLDLSKIEAGQMSLNAETINLGIVVPAVLGTLRGLAATKSVELKAEGFNGLSVHADPQRLRQILTNLIGNALKFTETGTIAVSAAGADHMVRIAVTDTGIGISDDALGYVFDEFRQADDTRTRRYGGTGLGLAISRKLVEMHGGQIGVESQFGEGSTFWFTLPVGGGNGHQKAVPAASEEVSESEVPWAGRTDGTVLVVDDEEADRVLICKRLQEAGFAPVEARSGEEALRLIESMRPAAITLDVKMPDMDGWSVLRLIKARPHLRDIPVILITMVDDMPLALAAGKVTHVRKPFTKEDLARALEQVLPPLDNTDIMVVDDDPSVAVLLSKSLASAQVTVRAYATGSEALRAVEVKRPDVMFVDLIMPEMSGFELIARLRVREGTEDVPLIVITSKQLTEADVAVLKGQVDRVLSKNELGGDLTATVRQALGHRLALVST